MDDGVRQEGTAIPLLRAPSGPCEDSMGAVATLQEDPPTEPGSSNPTKGTAAGGPRARDMPLTGNTEHARPNQIPENQSSNKT